MLQEPSVSHGSVRRQIEKDRLELMALGESAKTEIAGELWNVESL